MKRVIFSLIAMMILAAPAFAWIETKTFSNSLAGAADPWVIKNPDGKGYYYCYSGYREVYVTYELCPTDFKRNAPKPVYTAPEGTMYSAEYWAPELHYLNGEWYIYVAADKQWNDTHRMYVLKCTGKDPLQPFEMVGKITDERDFWAIDGGVLKYKDKLYFIWSGAENPTGVDAQNIYIAEMESPTKIKGKGVMLSKPEYDWEKITVPGVPLINEGPTALYRGNKVYIVYSASFANGPDYCLGLLTFKGGDILNPKNWTKSKTPVMSKVEGVYGPGHCSFIKDATENDWIVYHCTTQLGVDWSQRVMRLQPFSWKDNVPVFGAPVPNGQKLEFPYEQ
ncbi:MAG: glycoside hydrolase family 43 protein [Abditibacteriota bacterium]|nr:glycoside hydrolase family 43 protein [Abditibacteriota bacterium]MBP5092740.1 glycoside hydrolase family 43 protein [Abditibacteriota bacterium]MBP5718857.1 glycoside hydrolase family 43 protein [Abditibacteriota bacterium]